MPIASPVDFICVPSERIGERKLVEGPARNLHDDVVERRLVCGFRHAGNGIRNLVERLTERDPRRDFRDRIARRFRGERRTSATRAD